ncbi:hypothetical protein BMH32_04620 [Leucobacter sp. OLJS4]|uniref:hypothetical protein n=1 Tax=unclassified Leucobacter TaxID=2621730 RepID=UPI000C184C15|nr:MULTISPECIES: hypothetical protein [unclassified Leucobacter]PIJ55280.1 hypothetical protein BMH30_01275 [Leucobacter sp. OLES1]PII81574.1 hypothetical protein BMH25_13695 [Leucobacter sp. OLCALW19]PII86246.1 hypothetical protein BMH26_14120 [Leucobacter sp. OLTLW20]PII90141.1 hypothetical protein BMH27_12285 [Leucobacter sp. OLAS13]PII97174.1 hypothetical protein BMH29_12970 [Leucobacter sp. OLDS2]
MTTIIRAGVGRTKRALSSRPVNPEQRWYAVAWAEDDDTGQQIGMDLWAFRATWLDAMAAAQQLRAEVERELLEDMHESLAARRTERAAQLAAETTTKRRQPVVIGPEMEPTA